VADRKLISVRSASNEYDARRRGPRWWGGRDDVVGSTDMATDAYDTGGVPDEQQAYSGYVERIVLAASRRERWLWALVAVSLLADVALTRLGLMQGLTEGNPVVRAAIADAGIGMLGALKIGAVSLGLTAWLAMPDHERAVVPLGLALPWLGATLVNATLLFG
jgi:predicted anti-sigma-YlaC factor YlaD